MFDDVFMIIGITIAIIIYLFVVQARWSRREKRKKAYSKPVIVDRDKPKPRYCPICGSPLGEDDRLFAEIYYSDKEGKKDKLLIKGCKYCYKIPAKDDIEVI